MINRLSVLIEKSKLNIVPVTGRQDPTQEFINEMNAYRIDKALGILWKQIDSINRDIERTKPWKLTDGAGRQTLKLKLIHWINEIYNFSFWLEPFLPRTSRRIIDILTGSRATKGKPLFPRHKH